MSLDKALDKLEQPQQVDETVAGLPCDLCDKAHTKVIAVKVDDYLAWEIHSPCLDKLAKRAVARIG